MSNPTTDHCERDIVAGLRQGSSDAWSSLYQLHCRRIWKYVAFLIGADRTAVADVVQETFLAAAQSARSFDSNRGSLGSWLNGIAHKQVAVHYRRSGRETRLQQQLAQAPADFARLAADAAAGVELEQSELAELVRQALLKLSSDYAALLCARYFEGDSIQQIQSVHGGTTEAIRSRLARARAEFRTVFSRDYPEWITADTN